MDAPLWVFYDGECGLCSRMLAWALARDRHGALRIEPYQSPLARTLLGELHVHAADELIVWSKGEGARRGAEAVAAMLTRLPGWNLAAALLMSPPVRPAARFCYRRVAANRRWFGSPACALPRPRILPRNHTKRPV